MSDVKFHEKKDEILRVISQRKEEGFFPNEENLILVEGFSNMPIHDEISGNIFIGGKTIPAIVVIGKTSGKMYFFAAKILLQDI